MKKIGSNLEEPGNVFRIKNLSFIHNKYKQIQLLSNNSKVHEKSQTASLVRCSVHNS